MKKAQTEIIGLVIAIILAITGMYFAVRFMAEGPADYKKPFAQAETASSMLNALLKTTSNCNGLSMAELLQNCAGKAVICGNGQNSCDYFIATAQKIFGQTLDKWGVDYEFRVFHKEETPLFSLGNACIADKKSNSFIIPASSGNLFARLDICG